MYAVYFLATDAQILKYSRVCHMSCVYVILLSLSLSLSQVDAKTYYVVVCFLHFHLICAFLPDQFLVCIQHPADDLQKFVNLLRAPPNKQVRVNKIL